MSHTLAIVALAFIAPQNPAAVDGAIPPQNPAAEVEGVITPQRIAAHVGFLSHDLLEGRGVGGRGDELARAYLRTQFELLGLAPGAADGAFEQAVPIVGITTAVETALAVKGPRGAAAFTAPDDYTAVAGGPQPHAAWDDAEIVFVGFGITAAELGWDDYGDFDLRGKVALVMNDDPQSEAFAGKSRLYYGRWSYKYEEAARRGAVGAIVIHTTASAGYPFQVIQATHGKEAFWLPFAAGEPGLAIRSWCTEEAAPKIAALGDMDLDELRRRAEQGGFRPVPLGATAELATANAVRELSSANVLGRLPGSDPALKEQCVVVTAHFDHLGIGAPKKDDAIYNGALDNASGTAVMLTLAEACARLSPPPRRTILFAAVTGEESGLLGSQYLAGHLPLPRGQVVANFNVDGINIWGATRDVAMVGHGKNTLTALAAAVAARRGRTLVPDPHPELGLFYRSDHFSFARVGVPSAYFKAGEDFVENKEGRVRLKNMYTAVLYHQPDDEYDERWRLDGATDDARLWLECLLRVADDDDQPRWTPGDEFEKAWQPAAAVGGGGK